MNIWGELAGAWRSMRYDLHHRPTDPAIAARPVNQPPRHLVVLIALGTMLLLGAAGAYLAVVSGLGAFLGGRVTIQPGQPPAAAEHGDPIWGTAGRPPAPGEVGAPLDPGPDPSASTGDTTGVAAQPTGSPTATPAPTRSSSPRPRSRSPRPTCCRSPSPSVSASPSPTGSSPSPPPSPSPEPTPSPVPDPPDGSTDDPAGGSATQRQHFWSWHTWPHRVGRGSGGSPPQ